MNGEKCLFTINGKEMPSKECAIETLAEEMKLTYQESKKEINKLERRALKENRKVVKNF